MVYMATISGDVLYIPKSWDINPNPSFKRLVDLEALHLRLQSAGVHPQPRFARDARAPAAQATTGFPGQVHAQVLVVDVLNAGAFRTCQRMRKCGKSRVKVVMSIYIYIQCEAPKIAKLVYNFNNYGLWYL